MRVCRLVSVATLAIAAFPLALITGCGAPPPPKPVIALLPPIVDARVGSSDGTPIHYRSEGNAAPTVVLVHGWTASSADWSAIAPALAADHRVVTLDLAGHGASGSERFEWTVARFADDVVAVADALALSDAVLVGHSLGAYVAVAAAPRLAGRLRGVIVVDSFQDPTQAPTAAEREAFLAPLRADFPTAADAFARRLFPAGADAAIVDRVAYAMASAPPGPATAMLESLWSVDTAAALRGVGVPVAAINSDLRPTNGEALHQLAPGFEVTILPGVGHYPHLERPSEFLAAVDAILARWTTPPPAPATPAPAPPASTPR